MKEKYIQIATSSTANSIGRMKIIITIFSKMSATHLLPTAMNFQLTTNRKSPVSIL